MPGPTGLTVLIGGVDRTALFKVGSIHIHDNLTSRNNAQLTIEDFTLSSAIRPLCGQPVVILDPDGTTRLFAGTVDDLDELYFNYAQPFTRYNMRIVDFNQIADRFLVAESFINPLQTLFDIVDRVNTFTLAGEGISTAQVQVGPVIPETKVFNYKTVKQVFNELQTLTNYVWWIDYNKVLYFVPRTGVVGPVTTLNMGNVLECQVQTSRAVGPYRNRQYVRAGTAETTVRTELLTGDGQRRSYNTSFQIAHGPTRGSNPIILKNSVSQTVGLHGLDTGKQFYWTRNANQVVMDDSGTPLISTDVLSVQYVGRYPSIVMDQSDSEITTRKTVEGGTGIYESLKTDQNLNDIKATMSLARALLARYGFIPQQLRVVTDQIGIRSGHLIYCDFPPMNVGGNYLVQNTEASDIGGKFMRFIVTLVNG